MLKLKSQNLKYVTASVLKNLAQNHIVTLLDFLQEDVFKLSSLTKLSLPEILSIRNEIFTLYCAPVTNGVTLYTNLKKISLVSTGIERLDTIMNGGIPTQSITEICGLADSGKTQLALQLAINCVKKGDNTVLYVNTKGDFSAVQLQKILAAQRYTHKEMAAILCKIRVVDIWSMDDLVELFRSIKNRNLVIENLALIIVDSLPCLMFQHICDENKIGLTLLNTIVNYSRFIGNEMNIGIVYINIQTRWIDSDINEKEDDCEASVSKEIGVEKRNRCLGKYWNQIPISLLLLEKIEDLNKNSAVTQIKITSINPDNTTSINNETVLCLSEMGIK